MVRSVCYIIVTAIIIASLSITEYFVVKRTFDTLDVVFSETQDKLEKQVCTKNDVLSLQKIWIKSKERLHVFIPHNEIKEVDLWVSECVYYAGKDDYKEAAAKIEVARDLFDQIPKTFLIRIENVL